MENTKPFYKKIWFIITTIALLIIILLSLTLGLIFGLSNSKPEFEKESQNGDFTVTHLYNNKRGYKYFYIEKDIKAENGNGVTSIYNNLETTAKLELVANPFLQEGDLEGDIFTLEANIEFQNLHLIRSYTEPEDNMVTTMEINADYYLFEKKLPVVVLDGDNFLVDPAASEVLGVKYEFQAMSNYEYIYSIEELSTNRKGSQVYTAEDKVVFRLEDLPSNMNNIDIWIYVGHNIDAYQVLDGVDVPLPDTFPEFPAEEFSYANVYTHMNDGSLDVDSGDLFVYEYISKLIPTSLSDLIRLT